MNGENYEGNLPSNYENLIKSLFEIDFINLINF